MFKHPLKSAIALGVFIFASLPSMQAEESPKEQLKSTIQQVIDILHVSDDDLATKRQRVLAALEVSFSFDIIIRRALGRNWNQLDETQQGQVTALISDLLISAYTRELRDGPKPQVEFSEPVPLSDNKIEIETTVTFKDRKVGVSYRLANIKGRGWQVYDVLVEGVSMVSNYRKQFDEHFQTKNGADLIKLLKGKLTEN